MRSAFASALLIAAAVLVAGTPAHWSLAHEPSTVEDDTQADEDSVAAPAPTQLDAIVVTATRREAPLGRVPISIFVLEGDELAGPDFHDYGQALPGLSFTEPGIAPGHDLAIRGINTNAGTNELRPLSAYYFGDTPLSYAVTPSAILMYDPEVEAIDLDRIELLRGPQGTHFGAHAMGGALRLIPNAPDPQARYGYAGVDVSTLAHGGSSAGARAMLNVPLVQGRGALRAVTWRRERGGWIDDPARDERDLNRENNLGLRLAGLWNATEDVRFESGVVVQRRDGDGFALDEVAEPDYVQTRLLDESERDAWWLGWADLDWRFDGWHLRSHSARFERAFDLSLDVSDFANEAVPFGVQNRNDQHEWIHELRAHSEGDDRRFDWLLGLFMQDRAYRGAQEFLGPGFIALDPSADLGDGIVSRIRTRTDLRQAALYGDLTWRLSERFEAAIGGRAFQVRDRNRTVFVGLFGDDDVPFAGDETGFTPRLSLRLESAAGRSFYASAAQGFRPGGANDPAGFGTDDCRRELTERGFDSHPPSVDSDSLWNYELGAKTHWFERRLFLNAALYQIDWDNIQTELAFECSGLVIAVNGGGARSEGVDLDLLARPIEALELSLTASYNRARFTEDVPTLGRGRGIALPGAPRMTYSLSFTWNFQRPGTRLQLEHAYVDASVVDPFSDSPLRIGDYHLTHATLAWEVRDWHAQLAVRNLFDARAVTGGHIGFIGAFEAVAPPRSIGLSLTRAF